MFRDPLTHPLPSASRQRSRKTRKVSDFAQSVQRPQLSTSARNAALRSGTATTDYTPSMESSLPSVRSRVPTKKRAYQRAAEATPDPAHRASDPTHCTISTLGFSNTSSRPSPKETSNRVASAKVGGEGSFRGGGSQPLVGSDDVFIVEDEDSGGRNVSSCDTPGKKTVSPSKPPKVRNTAQLQKPGSVHPPSPSSRSCKPSVAQKVLRSQSGEWDDQCLGLTSKVSVMAAGSEQQEVQTLSDEEEGEGLSALQMVSAGLGASGASGSREQRHTQRPSSEGTVLGSRDDIAEVVRDDPDPSCEYVCTTSEYFEPPGARSGSRSGSRGSTSVPLQRRGPKGVTSERAVTDSEDEFKLELEREDTESPAPASDDKPGDQQGRSVLGDGDFEDLSNVPDSLDCEATEPPAAEDHTSSGDAENTTSTVARVDSSEALSPESQAALRGFKNSCHTFGESSQRQFATTSPSHGNSSAYGSRLRSSNNRAASNTGSNDHQSIANKAGAKSDGQKRVVRLRGANGSHATSYASSRSTAASDIEVEFDFDETLSSGGVAGLPGRGGPFNPFAKKGTIKPRPSLIMHSSKDQRKVSGTHS